MDKEGSPFFKIEIVMYPWKLIPNYKTGKRHPSCIEYKCTQCRVCLHPAPRENFEFTAIDRWHPENLKPGEIVEVVEYSDGQCDYYTYTPIHMCTPIRISTPIHKTEDNKGLKEHFGVCIFISFIFILVMPFIFDALDEVELHI